MKINVPKTEKIERKRESDRESERVGEKKLSTCNEKNSTSTQLNASYDYQC